MSTDDAISQSGMKIPTAAEMPAIVCYILQTLIIPRQGPGSSLAAAVGSDRTGKISPVIYIAAVPLAFVSPWASAALYVLVALIWLVPDRRIERMMATKSSGPP